MRYEDEWVCTEALGNTRKPTDSPAQNQYAARPSLLFWAYRREPKEKRAGGKGGGRRD